MLYTPKGDDYLKILTDGEVKHFIVINFSDYFKSPRKEQSLRTAAKSLYVFLTTPDEVQNRKMFLIEHLVNKLLRQITRLLVSFIKIPVLLKICSIKAILCC